MNEEQEMSEQEYSFLEESHEEKDRFNFNFEEKKKPFLVEDNEETCFVKFKSMNEEQEKSEQEYSFLEE